ncbi:MAG: tetratricopeptide repeat protein [Thermodesulfobacteriota bacterium]
MTKKLFILTTICSALLLLSFSGCSAPPSTKAFDDAELLYSQGEYDQALNAYLSLLSKFPESPHAPKSQFRTAHIYNRYLENIPKALKAYAELFYLYPESSELESAALERAKLYSSVGEHWNAIEDYKWLLEKSTKQDHNQYLYQLAMEYVKLNDFKQARVELAALLGKSPKLALAVKAKYQIATTYYLQSNHKEAIKAYEEIINNHGKSEMAMEAIIGKGASLEESGKLSEALAIFKSIAGEYKNTDAINIKISLIEKKLKKGPYKKSSKKKKR